MRALLPVFVIVGLASPASGNLLRNGDFQDDWITLLPETKNHHWCFPSEFFNRRDFNPDGWYLKGNWEWRDAELPRGRRRLILRGPGTEVYQRVNWIALHDDRALEGFPDAGGFPVMRAARSKFPERLLGDLTLRVRVTAQDVPEGASVIELGLCPPAGTATGDPMGTRVPPTAVTTAPLPAGTYVDRTVEVKLPLAVWLDAARQAAAKNPAEAAEIARSGLALPSAVSVAIRYQAKTGSAELHHAELTRADRALANLLPNGGFEDVDAGDYPRGWSAPAKYRYFPPRHYYIFNTWHNTNFANRGHAAADVLVPHTGRRSLRMCLPAGDEAMVLSDPIALNQKEPRLLEVAAWVKTDNLCMLQIDAIDDEGRRLDGFNFIHKAPVSIGTDRWRLVGQVFRPRAPVKSVRLALCARGVNGFTLDDTGEQPQSNVVGTAWWDEVRLAEPETPPAELTARGVKLAGALLAVPPQQPYLLDLDLGERRLGKNVLRGEVFNPGPDRTLALSWQIDSPKGEPLSSRSSSSTLQRIKAGSRAHLDVPYELQRASPGAYVEFQGRLSLVELKGEGAQKVTILSSIEVPFATWTTPIDLELGALYLQPEQKQFVRLNLGFASATLAELSAVRLDLVRRGTGAVAKSWKLDASPAALTAQRQRIPLGLRDDFAGLLLADLDVSSLPLQPFTDPQRNWLLRATAVDGAGKERGRGESPPFCRLAHEPPQPSVRAVAIRKGMVHVNDQPWLPFGVTYGHTPAYDGPADPGAGKYRDLANLPGWSMYDRHNSASSNRKGFDFNCLRYVAGAVTDLARVEKRWAEDNLLCSTAFAVPGPVFSTDELFKAAGGKDKLDAYLAACRQSPAVVAVTPGIEEAFGLFTGASPEQLRGMGQVVDYLRKGSGRPVMVGHGGYWNRLEFEKVPYFDIFDPETEPLYPANLHTDLAPLLRPEQAVWLRPQMYESVPYERWRFHTFVELMRGARGWQIAHGPGDPSLFRGLHGELEFFKPIVASDDPGPKVRVEPWLEHWSRRHQGKTYVIAATTRGLALGRWQESDDSPPGQRKSRTTHSAHELRDESNAYAIGEDVKRGPSIHGIQYLPDARTWPAGSRLEQWVKLDGEEAPRNLVVLIKADGRWTHAASWGPTDLAGLRKDPARAYWFLNSFYRHAKGFLGWGTDLLPKALDYVPGRSVDQGPVPEAGAWRKLEVPLDSLGTAGKLIDGVGFLHEGGRVSWGHTRLVAADGTAKLVWGDTIELPPEQLRKVAIHVEGLKAGTRIRVLFEDRELTADDGFFVDDFRGRDLYQRHGGGPGIGYGSALVALHLYEVP